MQEIAVGLQALDQNMGVVGHQAIGMDGKAVSCGFVPEDLDKPAAGRMLPEGGMAVGATERDEEPAKADIVLPCQAEVFAFEVHRRGEDGHVPGQETTGTHEPQKVAAA